MKETLCTVKFSSDFVEDVRKHAKNDLRSVPKQIEHWAKLGKNYEKDNSWLAKVAQTCKENPDLPYYFVEELLEELENPSEATPWTEWTEE